MNLFSSLLSWWNQIWGLQGPGSIQDLCNRLGCKEIRINKHLRGFNDAHKLKANEVPLGYWWHKVPKRSGKTRLLYSPNPVLKQLQRLLLRKLFKKLKVHPAARGFRRGESTVTH